jgi:hypothetical protein
VQVSQSPGRRLGGGHATVLAFIGYVVMAVWATWPLASAPARLGPPNMDVYGNIWAMAWVERQAVRDPAHLFDSNMFRPWTKSLGYAESLLPQALQAAPVRALGGSPLLAYNVVFLLTFALSGLGAYLLAFELCGSRGAAFLAGLAFGFFAYRWHHLVHLQSLSTQWLPLALLQARRAMRVGATRHFVGLGLFSLLQVLSSGYYAMLVGLALAAALAFEWRRERRTERLMRAAVALGVAACLALPVFLQHRALQARHGFSRGRAESIAWSARFGSYLDPGPYNDLPHLATLRGWTQSGQPLFPGSWALGFGCLGLWLVKRRAEARLSALWLTIGLALSLGPVVTLGGINLPGPFELFRLLPGGALLRTPSRLAVLTVLGLDMLAALAWVHFVKPLRAHRVWLVLAVALVAIELLPTEVRGAIREMPRPRPVAEWLSRAQEGVVLELPWYEPADSALYLFWSTVHWQPMINGYSDHFPADFRDAAAILDSFPSNDSFAVLRRRRVRYLGVHWNMFGARAADIRERLKPYARHLRELSSDDQMTLYEVVSFP